MSHEKGRKKRIWKNLAVTFNVQDRYSGTANELRQFDWDFKKSDLACRC